MNTITRGIIITAVFLLAWQVIIWLFQLPPYILPSPVLVAKVWYQRLPLLAIETVPTVLETLFGLFFAALLGCGAAITMSLFKPARHWMLPVLIISQALPIFAIAPLLVLWLGYGIASKIATTILMLFFPITSAFFDGLKRTELGWLDLAKTMNATPWQLLWKIRVPAALPALASGLRVATVVAPIGAVVGEWVGASQGLGFLMLNANARLEIDLMFAALFTIVLFSLALYFSVNKLLKLAIPWQNEH